MTSKATTISQYLKKLQRIEDLPLDAITGILKDTVKRHGPALTLQ